MTEQILEILIVAIAGTVGTFGITMLFGIEVKKIPWALLVAAISCVAYEIPFRMGAGYSISAFVAAVLVATYSDVMAHILKTPATVMIISGIIPLVPGGMLYYTMLGLVQSDMEAFETNGRGVLSVAAGLAVGLIVMTAISRPLNAKIAALSRRKSRNIKKKL